MLAAMVGGATAQRAGACALLAGALGLIAWRPTAWAQNAPSSAFVAPPVVRPIDWDKLTAEAADLLSRYIQVNTAADQADGELRAARLLREKFLADGVPAVIWEPAPGRAVLVARLRGMAGGSKALLLLTHMDVAPAGAAGWKQAPYSGAIRDGEVWGRGAILGKGPGVLGLMAMLAIKRSGLLLRRDIVFVAAAGGASPQAGGAQWLAARQAQELSDVGYVLNEGPTIRRLRNGHLLYPVAVAAKGLIWLRVEASGPEQEAAVATAQSQVTRLLAALARLATYHPAPVLSELVVGFFRALAGGGAAPAEFKDLAAAFKNEQTKASFLATPAYRALVTSSVTPTVLSAGRQPNMIAPEAYAELDCRLLPGQDPKKFLAEIEALIGDGGLKTKVLRTVPPTLSPDKSILMNAIGSVAWAEDHSEAVPTLSVHLSDTSYFREHGAVGYDFTPWEVSPELARAARDANERVELKSLRGGIKRMVEILEFFGKT